MAWRLAWTWKWTRMLMIGLAGGGFLLVAAGAGPAGAQGGATDAVQRELLGLVNRERAAAGAPPLRLSAALSRAAQRHAAEIARRGSLRPERGEQGAMDDRLKEEAYDAHEWAESMAAISGGPAAVLPFLKQRDAGSFGKLVDPRYRDLGIGLASLGGAPLYVLLAAEPESAAFARETADLVDPARVRSAILAEVNATRRRAGLAPLAGDPRLDRAAQQHAEDMLARSYFDHRSPEGSTVRERTRAAGYAWSAVGENIAEGQRSVEEAVESWRRSRTHRENLLGHDYVHLGTGLALGRDGRSGEYRVIWVQVYARPQGMARRP
ncbi:MAG TPA: CAP domain-containing protein [Thermoanaerobaculia bacterium]|nr:CAP domain-containing protein [Thermoanaerobaculia bacterium]